VSELERLQRNYRAAFLRYLPQRDEAALHAGYQMGRGAVAARLSLLDLAQVHHQVLFDVIKNSPAGELDDIARAASDFFVEVLATYDMTQRGFVTGS
jgi:hypothetical protein